MIKAGGALAGPLSQNSTPDEACAVFSHPIKGAAGISQRPVATDGRVMRLIAIGQCRRQRAGPGVGECAAVEPFASVAGSDFHAHADHDFEGGSGPLGPLKEQ